MSLPYYILDVFSSTPLEGNPLAAVVSDGSLSEDVMQRVAAEFNLSETIFIEAAKAAENRARIRIFTRTLELPFAGHPSVGAAVLLGHLDGVSDEGAAFGLEEAIGTLPCRARRTSVLSGYASFELPRLPDVEEANGTSSAIAAALSLDESDIGFGNHLPVEMSAGTPFTAVPVRDIKALQRARPREDLWRAAFGSGSHAAAFVYSEGGVALDASYHARVFAPNQGIREDPATGSATAAFIGAMIHAESAVEGTHRRVIEQGFEVGRPSRLIAEFTIEAGKLSLASVGGDAVIVGKGELLL
jgi:trans-2,3-dihydro-3-hydroxyanthranilate isomerase